MAAPVKVSDSLLALAREEARAAHRSATAQIEHWATLGRAVEAMVAYRDVLALKRAGEALPLPAFVTRADVHALLARLVDDADDREAVKARIRGDGGPVYAADPERPGAVVEIQPDRARASGLEGRRFVAAPSKTVVHARRKAARRK